MTDSDANKGCALFTVAFVVIFAVVGLLSWAFGWPVDFRKKPTPKPPATHKRPFIEITIGRGQ